MSNILRMLQMLPIYVVSGKTAENSTGADGYIAIKDEGTRGTVVNANTGLAVSAITDITGLTAWKDYIPVQEYVGGNPAWTTYVPCKLASGSIFVPPGVTAQYWQVLMVTAYTPGLNSKALDSVKFFSGGVEASVAGATYANDPNGGSGIYGPQYAFDGMTSSSFYQYLTNNNAPQPAYARIIFPAPITVDRVDIGYGTGSGPGERLADFTIQYSTDGVSWSTFRAVTGHGLWTSNVYEQFTQA